VLRVDELAKLGGCPCLHQLPEGGCAVHAQRPEICRAYRCAWLEGAFEETDRPDRLGAVLDLQSRGDSVRLVVRQMDAGALARSPRLQEIVSEVRRSLPVEIRDVDDVLASDRPYRVLQPDGDELEIEGDRVRVRRQGQLLYERRAPWLERTLRAIQQRFHARRLRRWPSHEERVTLLGLGGREDS
jgi:Fe-S-cluster containining protein